MILYNNKTLERNKLEMWLHVKAALVPVGIGHKSVLIGTEKKGNSK